MTRNEGRRFGLTLGIAVLAIAALTAWRGHSRAAVAAGVVGAALAVAGLAIPTRLGRIERAWMRLAHAMSAVTSPIAMAVVYISVFLPVGVVRRLVGGNPLIHRERAGGFWRERPSGQRRSDMRRQF